MSDQTTTLSQDQNIGMGKPKGTAEIPENYKKLCRQAAAEGMVLLKNNGVMPLNPGETVSVFGRVQYDYFYVGYGSGGDVIAPYKINLLDGLKNHPKLILNQQLADIYTDWCKQNRPPAGAWGNWPLSYDEMPITPKMAQEAATASNIALVVIGRCAGEDLDCKPEEGSYYLTATERDVLKHVTSSFDKTVVVINAGNTIDLSWLNEYKVDGLLYAYQGGMESGNAIADILAGDVNPCGKLTSAIANAYEDYPTAHNFGNKEFTHYEEDIYLGYRYFNTFGVSALFSFGYGLSYTTFRVKTTVANTMENEIQVITVVKNTGNCPGKEVVQVYASCPENALVAQPSRYLVAYAKTDLLAPGESQAVTLSIPLKRLASYDDTGATGHKSAYVLQEGIYNFYYSLCEGQAPAFSHKVDKTEVLQQLQEAAAPEMPLKRLVNKNGTKAYEEAPARTTNLKQRIWENLPAPLPASKGAQRHFEDVIKGLISTEIFAAQLSFEELEGLTRGDFIMNSPLGIEGNAGVLGGVTPALMQKGVKPMTACDGPSGIRLNYYCALLPCATVLASTWDMPLLEDLGTCLGEELGKTGAHILLAPSLNLIRSPLCGRNFEYYSEDPLLAGLCGAAMVKGIQKNGLAACPKVIICNEQEAFRSVNDVRISERALREMYLKVFEICIAESAPKTIMTSYNKINGVWGHYHYEICTAILREEFGYKGSLITDWWMSPCVDPNFPDVFNDGYRIRSQVDVLMPGGISYGVAHGDGSLPESYSKEGGITLGEIQRSAVNVLNTLKDIADSACH